MPTDLTQLIRSLSPGALAIFKRQLSALPETDRQRAFSRLSGIKELEDIVGRKTPMALLTAPTTPQLPAQPRMTDIPLWQRGLQTIGKPLEWISQNITEPFGAYATSLATPAIAGTERMGWAERERAEYKGWKAPWGVKGFVEMLPWLAVPSAGTILGRLTMMAKAGGSLGRGAALAAKAIKPFAAVEAVPGKIIGKVAGKVLPQAQKILGRNPSEIWKDLSKPQRMTLANAVGLKKRVDWRNWDSISPETQKLLVDKMTKIGAQPEKYRIISEMFPEGFEPIDRAILEELTSVIKQLKPIRAGAEPIYRAARAKQAAGIQAMRKQPAIAGGRLQEELARVSGAMRLPGGELPTRQIVAGLTPMSRESAERLGAGLYNILKKAPIKDEFEYKNILGAMAKLLDTKVAGMPTTSEFRLIEKFFGSDLTKVLLSKRPLGRRVWEQVMDVLNAPIALLASCDISGLLRQGGILVARHPIEGLDTIKPMIKSLFSDKNASLVERIILGRVGMDELLDPSLPVALYQSPLPTKVAVRLAEREEVFASAILNKLRLIKASNRAYVTVLNDMRSRSALNTLNYWKRTGFKYTKGDISDLNRLVNWASGRGDLPGTVAGALRPVLFAPRWIASKIEFPLTVLPMVTKSAAVRREAWNMVLAGLGAGAGILTMAKLSGVANIELDPRSADFGKLKSGETRLDFWTGYSQYIRFLTQLAIAQRKTAGGRIQTLNRMDVIQRFIRSKLSPAAGLMTDLVKGETFLGEELPPKSVKGVLGQIYQRTMPLAIQDMIDAVLQDGPLGAISAAPGFAGVGIITYTDEARRARDKAARAQYGMNWDEIGRQYGRATQLRLEQTTPAILEAEKEEERRFAVGTPTTMQMWQNEGQAIEDTYRRAIGFAVSRAKDKGDWVQFREDVDDASKVRRESYSSRARRTEYQDIVAYYNQPLTPEQKAKMNPGDVLRREYYQQMFSVDMYDPNTNEYDFDEARRREQKFLAEHGQQALDYIEDYRGARWVDKPVELKMLEQARELLRPYWQITDNIWSMYPPELKTLSDQIQLIDRTDPDRARQMLRKYPMILRARELIAKYKKQMRDYNPAIRQAHRFYYG